MKIAPQKNSIKQKLLQRTYMDDIFKSRFKGGSGSPYPDSLIGNFVDYYSVQKAVSMLPFSVRKMSVLSICCGDGPEGEFFYKLGAKVTVSDFSSEAVKSAIRRCKYLKGVVADAEDLPFKDKSYDLVLVRHGLHHIPHPFKGLDEMGRVGRKGFIFIEAQRNFITKVLIRLKLAEEYEESGNFVYRFTRKEVEDYLERKKIKSYKISTFWVYHFEFLSQHIYPHLNNKFVFGIYLLLFYSFNFLFGYLGNAMVVVALKE